MISPTVRKALSDILGNRGKSLLVIASLALGILTSGISLHIGYALIGDLNAQYRMRRPHDFIIKTVDAVPGGALDTIADGGQGLVLEARGSSIQRMVDASGAKSNANLFAIGDFASMKVDALAREDGSPLPGSPPCGGCFFERSTKDAVGLRPGDKVPFERLDGKIIELVFEGYVHDLTTEPYKLDGDLSAYCTFETLALLQGDAGPNEIRGYVIGGDSSAVGAAVQDLSARLEKAGARVDQATIPKRGEHPLAPIIRAVILVLSIIGAFSAFAAGALIANTITTLLVQQRRQIGIMKALGASRARVFGMYLLYISLLSAVSYAVALAGTAALGRFVSGFLASLLNFDLLGFRLYAPVVLVELAAAILVPAIASAIPLHQAVSMTVKQAMGGQKPAEDRRIPPRGRSARRMRAPSLFISIRNLGRAPGKMFLSLLVLAFGGSLFISIGNLNQAFGSMLASSLRYFRCDVVLTLGESVDAEAMRRAAAKVEGVVRSEAWPFAPAQILVPGSDATCKILLMAPPVDTAIVDPEISRGRMIAPGDRNAIFINNHLVQKYPRLDVGSEVRIRVKGEYIPFTVVGIGKTMGQPPHPSVFADPETLCSLLDGPGKANNCYLVTERHDEPSQRRYALAAEAEIERELGSPVKEINTGASLVGQYSEPMEIVSSLLLFLVALAVSIGAVGLGGAIGINVIERRRELGVFRAIGAGDRSILAMVILEGAAIACLSLPGSAALAVPITLALDHFVGRAMFTLPLPFEYGWRSAIAWSAIIVGVGVASGLIPAIQAVRIRVRSLLAQE